MAKIPFNPIYHDEAGHREVDNNPFYQGDREFNDEVPLQLIGQYAYEFDVPSYTVEGVYYTVTLFPNKGRWVCDCPHYTGRLAHQQGDEPHWCKHIRTAQGVLVEGLLGCVYDLTIPSSTIIRAYGLTVRALKEANEWPVQNAEKLYGRARELLSSLTTKVMEPR